MNHFYSAKSRIDHAARRFELPEDLVNLDTKHPHIPPIFVIQIQIPSEPPPSMFIAVEDGPGWSFLLFFKISEVYYFHLLVMVTIGVDNKFTRIHFANFKISKQLLLQLNYLQITVKRLLKIQFGELDSKLYVAVQILMKWVYQVQ